MILLSTSSRYYIIVCGIIDDTIDIIVNLERERGNLLAGLKSPGTNERINKRRAERQSEGGGGGGLFTCNLYNCTRPGTKNVSDGDVPPREAVN